MFDSTLSGSDLHVQEAASESYELKALADSLPDVLLFSRAHSMVVKYSGGLRRNVCIFYFPLTVFCVISCARIFLFVVHTCLYHCVVF